MRRLPQDVVQAAVLFGEEHFVKPRTSVLVLLHVLIAQAAGCTDPEEGRAWAVREGYMEHVGGGQYRFTDYGEWAACVWATTMSGRSELTA